MTRYSRRTLLKTSAAFAGASALGFPAISYGQAEIGLVSTLTGRAIGDSPKELVAAYWDMRTVDERLVRFDDKARAAEGCPLCQRS